MLGQVSQVNPGKNCSHGWCSPKSGTTSPSRTQSTKLSARKRLRLQPSAIIGTLLAFGARAAPRALSSVCMGLSPSVLGPAARVLSRVAHWRCGTRDAAISAALSDALQPEPHADHTRENRRRRGAFSRAWPSSVGGVAGGGPRAGGGGEPGSEAGGAFPSKKWG